jgi:ABC-type branched-subunit amino acid transport system substrate-binding protein
MCFSQVNAAGGVHGRPLQLVSLDDAQDAKRAADNTQKLLEQGAIALALYRTTPCIGAALPLVQKANAPFIGAQVGPLMLYEPAEDIIYNTRSRYHDEVARVVQFFAPLGLSRVAALVAADAFGNDVLAGLLPAIAAAKAELVAQATIDNRSADVASQLKLLRAAAPQVLLLVCNAKAAAEFVKAAKGVGFNPTFVSLSNTSSASYVKDLGPAAEGVVVTQVVPTPHSGRLRVVADFRAAQAAAGAGAPPLSHAALQGWLTARFIAELVGRAGPLATRERMVELGRAGPLHVDLGDFSLNYAARNRQGSRLAELTVTGRDGRFLY